MYDKFSLTEFGSVTYLDGSALSIFTVLFEDLADSASSIVCRRIWTKSISTVEFRLRAEFD